MLKRYDRLRQGGNTKDGHLDVISLLTYFAVNYAQHQYNVRAQKV